jgi:amidase
VIGKTNTPEFGLGSHTFNPVFGTTRNAWDPAARLVAAAAARRWRSRWACVPVADGSDTGGSLRNPAAFNNVDRLSAPTGAACRRCRRRRRSSRN